MFKKLFGREKKRAEVALVFDIGSGSVAGSVVHFPGSSSQSPRVIYTKRLPWHTGKNPSFDELLRAMKYTLGNVARHIQERDFPLTMGGNIYVTLSAPWFAHDIRRAELSRNSLFTVTQNILDGMFAKEMKAFCAEGEQVYGEDFEVIEKSILDVSLHGYSTDKPLGKKTKHINISMYVSVAPRDVVEMVEDTIGRVFHREAAFQSSALVTYIVSRDYFAREKDYVCIDIGGELTDILVVRDNQMSEAVSFPLGIQFFMQSIADTLGTSVHEAHSLLMLRDKGALHDTHKKSLTSAVNKAFKVYDSHLEGALRQFAKDYKLPQKIYLAGFGPFENGVEKVLGTEHLGHYSMLGVPFETKLIHQTDIHTYLRYQSGVVRDLFIALSALYRNRL